MGDQRAQACETIECQQTGDTGVLGVVLLPGGTPPTCGQVRVDRDHDVARVDQSFDEHAVPRLDHDADLSRIGFKLGDLRYEDIDRLGAVLDSSDVNDAVTGPSQRDQMKLLCSVDANSQHIASFRRGEAAAWTKARRRSDGPVLVGRHPCGRRAFKAVSQGRSLMSVLVGQESEAFPGKDLKKGG